MSKKKTDGMSLFFADLDPAAVEVRELHKLGRAAVDTNMLFIDNLKVPASDLIGGEGRGFHSLLDGLNPERILIAAEAIGIGTVAIKKAVRYAKERIVFGRPIGQNQAIAHPLADSYSKLEAADLMMMKAAWLFDNRNHAARRPTSQNFAPPTPHGRHAIARCKLSADTDTCATTTSSDIFANAGC